MFKTSWEAQITVLGEKWNPVKTGPDNHRPKIAKKLLQSWRGPRPQSTPRAFRPTVHARAAPNRACVDRLRALALRRYIISNCGKTVTKGPIRDEKPLWYQQGCLFDEVIQEGQKNWAFTINHAKYDDVHMFLGVADATGDGMAWALSPTTGSLYFHADLHKWGKETKTRIMPGDALFGRKDGSPGHTSAQYVGELLSDVATAPTRIPHMIDATIKCIVDMDKQVTRHAPTQAARGASSAPRVSSAGWAMAVVICGRVRSRVERGRSTYSCSSHMRLSVSLLRACYGGRGTGRVLPNQRRRDRGAFAARLRAARGGAAVGPSRPPGRPGHHLRHRGRLLGAVESRSGRIYSIHSQ